MVNLLWMSATQRSAGVAATGLKLSIPRLRRLMPLAAFCIAFAGTLEIALSQGIKPFYYDAGQYWQLGDTFTVNGHFSLLNFSSPIRGYIMPLIDHELQLLSTSLKWNPSSLVKLLNVLIFASVGAVLAPKYAQIIWPSQRWGIVRRLLLASLLIAFWSGYLNFPLSDFFALAMALLALVAVAHPDNPGWMLVSGAAGALAIDARSAYLIVGLILLLLIAGTWLDRHVAVASHWRRAVCIGLFIVGFAVVSLPQSLSAHRYNNTWSFVPGPHLSLEDLYLEPGMAGQRYDTYVGIDHPGSFTYAYEPGLKLLHAQKDGQISSVGQYLGLIVSHPLVMGGLYLSHFVNGVDARYTTVYVEHLETKSHLMRRIVGFLLVFAALVRVLWPAARRRLGPGRWRYAIALPACCLTSIATAVEVRYLLPIYLIVYMIALAPGWPNPIGPADAGWRRFQTPVIIALAGLVFALVVVHVTGDASSHVQWG